MPNTNCLEGFKCPKCGHTKTFHIVVQTLHELYMDDNGTIEDSGGDNEWDDNSDCRCGGCGLEGQVGHFHTEPGENSG